MTLICEDRSTYNPDIDPVSRIVLTIECSPGQVDALVDFLAGVERQAGVYHAAFEANTLAPMNSPVAVEEVLDAFHVEPEIAEPERPDAVVTEPVATESVIEGDGHGERAIQFTDHDAETSDLGQGGDAAGRDATEVGPADANSGLSGAAGASTEAGPLERDT